MCVTVCAGASRCFNPQQAFTDSVSSHSLQKYLLLDTHTCTRVQIFSGTRSAMQTGPLTHIPVQPDELITITGSVFVCMGC